MYHPDLEILLKRYFEEKNVPEKWQEFLQDVNTLMHSNKENELKNLDKVEDEIIRENYQLRNEKEELKKAHFELGRIFNSINQGFFSRDMTTNKYTYLSAGIEKIYGYKVDEFFENSLLWYDVIHPEDKLLVESDEDRLNNEEELCTQYRIILKDQRIKWLELKVIPCFKNGKLSRIDGVVTDITQRKQVEAERELMIQELMKRNADLKQFSFITSHNLRAPLSNILGILNLIEYPETDSANGQLLDMLKNSAQQLNKTIDDLTNILLIKNNDDLQLSQLSLKETFREVYKVFINALDELDAKVITNFCPSSILLNKVYLESIFINLLSNAIRYRSPERQLVIKIDSCDDSFGNVIMKFTDNGIGIDLKRHKSKVFGLYQRFHEDVDGQGMGLFIVKSQIEAGGGNIEVESRLGEGTTFILTFRSHGLPQE